MARDSKTGVSIGSDSNAGGIATAVAPSKPKGGKGKGQPTAKQKRAAALYQSRSVLTAARLSVKSGGATERMGKIVKALGGFKFDGFSAADVADLLDSADFAKRFDKALDAWMKEADPAVAEDTVKMRERQYKACKAFIAGDGHKRVATAIRTLLEHDALRWTERGEQGDYGMTLQRAVTELLGINITAARRMKLTVGF